MSRSEEIMKTAIRNFRNDPEVDKWQLGRREARRKFREFFRRENLDKLTREGFSSFLELKNNKSWTGLQRRGALALGDMERLKKAISHLQDEEIDVGERLNDVVEDKGGEYYVNGMGRNLATAILYVRDEKDRYGVWNERSEKTLKKLGLIPETISGYTPIRKAYPEVNKALKSLENYGLKDLNEVDHFMYWLDEHPDEVSKQAKRTNMWLEKTLVSGRLDRESGPYALGKALWSPQRDKRGADIYGNMRKLDMDDLVLHLVDNDQIVGISTVKSDLITDFHCLPGTKWDDGTGERPGYLRELKDFKRFDNPIHVYAQILENDKYKKRLKNLLMRGYDLFCTSDLKLREGAYLTEVPEELLRILGEESPELKAHDVIPTFSFTAKDFESCTGKKTDARYLSERLKTLLGILKENLVPELREFTRGYISRPFNRGTKKYNKYMWLGLVHDKLKDKPQECVQFQVSINPDDPFSIDIFIHRRGRKAKREAKSNIEKNKNSFLKQINSLEGYDIGYSGEGPFSVKTNEMTEDHLNQFLKRVDDAGTHVYISKVMEKEETINKGTLIVDEIFKTWKQLLPAYKTMAFGKTSLIGLGQEILGDLLKDERADLAKLTLAHLVAGKNVVFYGAPATGKTRLARQMCEQVCGENYDIETANSEWSHYDIVGGLRPIKEGAEWKDGLLTQIVKKCHDSLKKGRPAWLIIDELNRANLDLAFGEVFTLLDIDYRQKKLLPAEPPISMPYSFRILATMNIYDRALLFSLGYAFMRRFAFVPIPSLIKVEELIEGKEEGIEIPTLFEGTKKIRDTVKKEMIKHLSYRGSEGDLALIFSEFAGLDIKTEVERTLGELKIGDLDFLDVLLLIAQETTRNEIIEIGQAIVIDAAKFLVTYSMLFPNELDAKLIDEAVVAYIMPQFEYYMPQLRKAIAFREEEYKERFNRIIKCTSGLGLRKTTKMLKNAEERLRVF